MDREAAGSKGGRTTFERHGREHFRELGRRGIRATAAKYFNGSIGDAMEYLRKKGYEFRMSRMAEQDERACIELPVVMDPEDDPFFEDTGREWRTRVEESRQDIELPF